MATKFLLVHDGHRYNVVLNSRLAWVLNKLKFAYAITLWLWTRVPTIYVNGPKLSGYGHGHEYSHVRRWLRLGRVGFLWVYLRDWVRFKYKGSPQETEAERDAIDTYGQFLELTV